MRVILNALLTALLLEGFHAQLHLLLTRAALALDVRVVERLKLRLLYVQLLVLKVGIIVADLADPPKDGHGDREGEEVAAQSGHQHEVVRVHAL